MIQIYFNEGGIYPIVSDGTLNTLLSASPVSNYKVYSESHLLGIIVPFFEAYPLYTTKLLDYQDWKTLLVMKSNNLHKSSTHLEEMKGIISRINFGRKDNF